MDYTPWPFYDAIAMLTWAAARTGRIRLRTDVMVPLFQQPSCWPAAWPHSTTCPPAGSTSGSPRVAAARSSRRTPDLNIVDTPIPARSIC